MTWWPELKVENDRLKAEVKRLTEAVAVAVAQVEVQRKGRERAEAEVRRLRGLILDWTTTSPLAADALLDEAERIRKREGEK